MKRILLLLALGVFLATPAFAQSQGDTSAPSKPPHPVKPADANGGPPPGGRMSGLTADERQELMTARMAAMQANPELAAEQKALQEKINAAMIKADPKVAPIIAKLEAAHQQHKDGQGGPGGSGSGSTGKPPPPSGN